MKDKTVTIPEAIDKGLKAIAYPLKKILIASMVLPAILVGFGFYKSGIFVLAAGLTAYFLYDLWAIPKWRLWAYEHVNDIHQFQRAAELEGLLRRQSHDVGIGFMNMQQKRKFITLRKRFLEESGFTDDLTVPSEVRFFLLGTNKIIVNEVPILALDSNGVHVGGEYTSWEDVKDERIARVSYDSAYNVINPKSLARRRSNDIFRFENATHRYEVSMADLNIPVWHLDYLLYIYKGRHASAKTNTQHK